MLVNAIALKFASCFSTPHRTRSLLALLPAHVKFLGGGVELGGLGWKMTTRHVTLLYSGTKLNDRYRRTMTGGIVSANTDIGGGGGIRTRVQATFYIILDVRKSNRSALAIVD
jgi:hypothetical protein